MENKERDQLYLVVISILLGISVLKINEFFQLGSHMRNLFINLKTPGLSLTVVGVFFFIGGYLIFFFLISMAAYGLVNKFVNTNKKEKKADVDLGPLLGLSIIALTSSYLILFAVIVHSNISI